MSWKNILEKGREILEKVGKKTLITICTVVVLGAAVILNVIVMNGEDAKGKTMQLAVDLTAETTEKMQTNAENADAAGEDYFQTMSLNRQQSRDEAIEVLLSVAESPTAIEEAREAALSDINRLAAEMEKETNIETMILSKGFTQCIAVIQNEDCSVIVESDGLQPGEIAQITEIVYEQAGIHPTRLKIVEKNSAEA